MQYRVLGRTGMRVSEIGLGSEAFVKQDDSFAQALLEAALAQGVNFFDLYNPEPLCTAWTEERFTAPATHRPQLGGRY